MPAERDRRSWPRRLGLPLMSSFLIASTLFVLFWREQQTLQQQTREAAAREVEREGRQVAEHFAQGLEQVALSVERYRTLVERRWLEADAVERDAASKRLHESVTRSADQAWRSQPEHFDAQRDAGIWVPAFVQPTTAQWAQLALANDVTRAFGMGARESFFVDSWYMPDFAGISIFWPDEPSFIYQAAPDFDYRPTEWVTLTTPENNPRRQISFTAVSFDEVARLWMISAVAPVYADGVWRGSVGHDMPLPRLLGDTSALSRFTGSRFVLLNAEHRVIASDAYGELITQKKGALDLRDLPDASLAQALSQPPPKDVKLWRIESDNSHIFVYRVGEQGWVLLHSLPFLPITSDVDQVMRRMQWYSIAALIALVVMAWIFVWRSLRDNDKHMQGQRLAQRTLEITLQKSEVQQRELAAISYGISHDLRAPLRHMSGYTQMLREQMLTRMNSEDLRLIHTIEYSNRRAARLIEKLLVYLRVTQQEMQCKTVQLQTIIERALVEAMASWPNARVEWDVSAVVTMWADPQLLREAFLQLIDNALAAVTETAAPQIRIHAQQRDDKVRLSVADNGHGFDPAKAEKIFEVFQKLEAATSEGPGIGLAVVRRVAERHGGRAWAESAPGRGTTISMELPHHAGSHTEAADD